MNSRERLHALIGVSVVAIPAIVVLVLISSGPDDEEGQPPSTATEEMDNLQSDTEERHYDSGATSDQQESQDNEKESQATSPQSHDEPPRNQALEKRVVAFAAAWLTQHPDDEPIVSRRERIEPYATDNLLDQQASLEEEMVERDLFFPEYRQPRAHEARVYKDIAIEEHGDYMQVTIEIPIVENPHDEPIVFRPALSMYWIEQDGVWYVHEIIDAGPFQ